VRAGPGEHGPGQRPGTQPGVHVQQHGHHRRLQPEPGFEGFDGIGTTYSAQGLAAAGLTPGAVTAGGLSFTWPDVEAAQPDNTMAQGQTIAIAGSGSNLGFVAAPNNSALSGTGTIYYTDDSTQVVHAERGGRDPSSRRFPRPVLEKSPR
jgi:hypothetical protein